MLLWQFCKLNLNSSGNQGQNGIGHEAWQGKAVEKLFEQMASLYNLCQTGAVWN